MRKCGRIEGDTIIFKFQNQKYKVDVIECSPNKAIQLPIFCHRNSIQLLPAKDYAETKNIQQKQSTIKIPKSLSQNEIIELIQDNKFSGHHIRLDGKKLNYGNVHSIINKKENEKEKEENYNPRECRIPSNPRPNFKNVDI